MNAQQLRNSILQQAIQGKLVPQDPADEPASVLLQRIRKEKEHLVKEGKLKKKDLESKPIEEEEIPFEIPKTWKWCRIEDLFIHASGKQQSSSSNGKGSPQKFITTSNLYWGRFVLEKVKVMNFTEEEIKTCSATKGDLLVCEGGAGYGRSAIWDKDYDICLQNHVHRLRPVIDGICEYVYHFIYYLKESNQLMSVGTAMPGLSANRLKGLVLPLPPLSEQHRIVAKIEELMPLVERYGKAQDELDKLNENLPARLRQSILQEAIQGRLVPQDPKEEPASELLKRIRKEKEQLVKEGKLKKKDLENKPIEEDEIPFEVPEGWGWCRLSDLANMYTGNSISETEKKAKYTDVKGIEYIGTKDVSFEHDIDYANGIAIPDKDLPGFKIAPAKAILLCVEGGSAGRKIGIIDRNVCFGNKLCCFDTYIDINKYLYYYLQSPLFKEVFKSNIMGIIGGVSIKTMKDLVVPLPPLSEQNRIVAKVEELFGVIG